MPLSVEMPRPSPSPNTNASSGVTATSERALSVQEEDQLMTDLILKHRADLQKFVQRMPSSSSTSSTTINSKPTAVLAGAPPPNPSPSPASVATSQDASPSPSPTFDPGFRTPQPARSTAAQRLLELSRSERTDRMRLAELSDVRNERLGRAALLKWNPHAKLNGDGELTGEREAHTYAGEGAPRSTSPAPRARWNSSPVRTTAKMLGEYTKDYVQQALDFNGADDDDEEDGEGGGDLTPPSPDSVQDFLNRQPPGQRPSKVVRKYVRHMEATIEQLVQQKDELERNQAEFDKHASGIFPTLETLNDQLSQIVQDRMAESQANLKDDVTSELRLVQTRVGELEAELRQRRGNAELNEQKREIDIAQIKGDIVSLETTSTLQNQKIELLTSQEKKVEQDLRDALKIIQGLSQEFHVVEKRISVLKNQRGEPTALKPTMVSTWRKAIIGAVTVLLLAIGMVLLSGDRCSGFSGRCRPLT